MIRRASLSILGAGLLASVVSCGRERPARPVSQHQGAVRRPGVVELETADGLKRDMAQTVYVPAYSHIFTADDARPYNLAVTLSVRNTDAELPVVVTSVDYFDQDGRLVRRYVKKPLKLAPMASVDFFVAESDTSGGSSASFLVDWFAEDRVNRPGVPSRPASEPVVEAVMIGTAGTQGISFVCPGRVVSGPHRSQ